MTRQKNVIVHWGGNMRHSMCGVDYEGGSTKLIRFRQKVSYNQLIEKIAAAMKIGLNQKVSRVVYRYPIWVQGLVNFSQLDIEDDDGVELIFDNFDRIHELNCVELYVNVYSSPVVVEQQPQDNNSQPHVEESMPHASQSQQRVSVAPRLNSRDFMHPGPLDGSVLTLQHVHRSEAVWHDSLEKHVLHCRRAMSVAHPRDIDARIVPYLQQAGFYGVVRIGIIQLDWHLITSLVERWRPETHTFHLPEGECTITLQDVGVLSGLPIDGQAVTGNVTHDWREVCCKLLGVAPPENAMSGSRVLLSWLGETFQELPASANDTTIQCYARAFILRLIGGVIFPDKSSCRVHLMFLPLLENFQKAGEYSWGAACLAWLYRELCRGTNPAAKEIGGPLFLLQLWALERLPHIVSIPRDNVVQEPHLPPGPLGCKWKHAMITNEVSTQVLKHYRYALDRQGPHQMIWQPYTDDVMAGLPLYCTNGHAIWGAVVPLICFHLVEWHQPDRVMRQFGLQQPIPVRAHQDDALHAIDLRGNQDVDWVTMHASYISLWDDRRDRVIHGVPSEGRLGYRSEYMEWYRTVTRRWISPMGAAIGAVADGIEHIYLNSGTNATLDTMVDINQTAASILGALDEERRTIRLQPTQRAPEPVQMPGVEPGDAPARRRPRRTMGDRRLPVENDASQSYIQLMQPSMLRMVAPASLTSQSARGRKHGRNTPTQINDLNSHVDTTETPAVGL